MKTSVYLLSALGLALSANVPAEAAQSRTRQTVVVGAQGKTLSRSVARDHGDVHSSTTLPSGKTSSRVVDRSPGQTTATVTGPNGQSATRTTTRGASAPQP